MDKVRILPLLVFAGLCLLVLKTMGLFLTGGYVFSGAAPAVAQNAGDAKSEADQADTASAEAETAQDKASEAKGDAGGTTGDETPDPQATDAPPAGAAEAKTAEAKENPSAKDVSGPAIDPSKGATKAERAILEGLSNRRKALNKRARELELRENLLKAAEKRVEAKIAELKSIESRIEGELKKRDDGRKAEYDRLVQMYSNMKPKDAARIFDRL
ncbi:MAG: hypothetical protein AAGF14_06810, partial [Pseudomonadota bacterium]